MSALSMFLILGIALVVFAITFVLAEWLAGGGRLRRPDRQEHLHGEAVRGRGR